MQSLLLPSQKSKSDVTSRVFTHESSQYSNSQTPKGRVISLSPLKKTERAKYHQRSKSNFGEMLDKVIENEADAYDSKKGKIMKKARLEDSCMMFVERDLITQRQPGKSFTSFHHLITNRRKQDSKFDADLRELRPSRDIIAKQLGLNKKSEHVYSNSVIELESNSFQKIYHQIRTQQTREYKMPPIRKYPSRTLNFASYFDESNKDSVTSPTTSHYDKLNPSISRMLNEKRILVFAHKGDEARNQRPEVREGATMTTLGKHVYLYGGKSKSMINKIDVLDTREHKSPSHAKIIHM